VSALTAAQVAVLIVVLSGILLYGYTLMRRLDKFIAAGGIPESPAARGAQSAVLIFGVPEFTGALAARLAEKGVSYEITDRPEIPEGASFPAVAALSESDLDNLLLCSTAKKLRPDILSFAVCNDVTYRRVFDSAGIGCVFTVGAGGASLPEALKGWVDANG